MSPERRPDSERAPASEDSPWGVLQRHLLRVLGDRASVATLLSTALSSAKSSSLPTSVAEVLAFADAHVLPQIERSDGSVIAKSLLVALEESLAERAPSSLPMSPSDSGRRRIPSI